MARRMLWGWLCVALAASCAYAWSEDMANDPAAGAGLVDTIPVEPAANFDMPSPAFSYDQPMPVDTVASSFTAYDQAWPGSMPVDRAMAPETLSVAQDDIPSTVNPGYDSPAWSAAPAGADLAQQPVDTYEGSFIPAQAAMSSEPAGSMDAFQDSAWDAVPFVSAADAQVSVTPVTDDLNTMNLAAVSADYKEPVAADTRGAVPVTADRDDRGIPAVVSEPDEPASRTSTVAAQGTRTTDIAQVLANAAKNGDMVTLKGGETIYRVDSAPYSALSAFMKEQGQDGGAVKFVDPKQYKNNPELYHNIVSGDFYVVDRDLKSDNMNIYKTNEEQIRASDKAGLPLSIVTSGIADGTVVQLVDENKKPTNMLVEYTDGVFLNAFDGRETWLKSGGGDKSNFYRLSSAESTLLSSTPDPSAAKQAILGAHEKGEEITLKGGETIYKVESPLYGMLSEQSKGQPGSSFADPQKFKGNPELYQNPENGQFYVVDKDSKTKETSIYKTSEDQVRAAEKAGLPLWIFSSGIADGTVVQLVDQNKQPTNLLIEYKDNIFVNAYDNRETWVKGKDASNFVKLPDVVGNALINSK